MKNTKALLVAVALLTPGGVAACKSSFPAGVSHLDSGAGAATDTARNGGTGGSLGTGGTAGAGGTVSGVDGSVVEPGPDAGVVDAGSGNQPWGTCGDYYDMCGCGCCGASTADSPMRCYYASAGETVETVRSVDQTLRNGTDCYLVGCALPVRAVCCADTAPNPDEVGTYTAGYYWYGSDPPQITITKVAPGVYAQLVLKRGAHTTASGLDSRGYSLGLPEAWGVDFATNLVSAWSAIPMNVFGAHGTIAFRTNGSDCLLDIHMTMFSTTIGTTAPSPLSGRLDADGIVVSFSGDAFNRTDFPASACTF